MWNGGGRGFFFFFFFFAGIGVYERAVLGREVQVEYLVVD